MPHACHAAAATLPRQSEQGLRTYPVFLITAQQ